MNSEPNWQQLARYFAGECSAEERRRVEAWTQVDASHRQLMEMLRDLWAASETAGATPPVDVDADWERLLRKMQAAPKAPAQPALDRAARRHLPRRPRRAVSRVFLTTVFVLLLGAAVLVVQRWERAGGAAPAQALREIVTERGERATLQLADGTQVTLNVESRLRLPEAFERHRREVHLQGEAFFEVKTDAARPFIVRTGKGVVEVHGTAFGVRSYPEERRVQVAVAEGSVSLHPEAQPEEPGARLQAGQVGRLAENEAQVTTEHADLSTYLGWTEGRLVFQNTALPEVAARLERWYDVEFELRGPSLDSLHLTASLKSRSLRDVLDVIAASLNIRYQITDSTVVLME